MPRVTKILSYFTEPELIGWIERNSKAKRLAIRNEAFRVGSLVDSLVQEDINNGGYLSPEGDEPVENCLKAWELFKKDHPDYVGRVKEMQVDLKEGEVTGHPDFVLDFQIDDLKCATSIRPSYWTQTSKYFRMRFGKVSSGKIGVLRLDKKSALYEYKVIDDINYINYENEVFDAYHLAFNHAQKNREVLRKQLEDEIL